MDGLEGPAAFGWLRPVILLLARLGAGPFATHVGLSTDLQQRVAPVLGELQTGKKVTEPLLDRLAQNLKAVDPAAAQPFDAPGRLRNHAMLECP